MTWCPITSKEEKSIGFETWVKPSSKVAVCFSIIFKWCLSGVDATRFDFD